MGCLCSKTEESYDSPQQQWHHTSSQSQWLQHQEEISQQEEVRRANELRRLKEQEELSRRANELTRLKEQEELSRKENELRRLKEQEELSRRANELRRLKEQEELSRRANELRRLKEQEELSRRANELRRLKEQEELSRRANELRRLKEQEELSRRANEVRRLKEQEELSRRANELRRLKEQEELRRRKQIQIEALRRKRTQSLVPISRRHICDAVLRDEIAANWSPMSVGQSTIKVNIPEDAIEYRLVMNGFKHTTKKGFNIVKIERIQNPHLLGCYLLKKLEMTSMFGSVREELVYHGTKQCNITSICENNFDWRLHGESIGNRFGKGVSFSPISYYASHYSDKYTPIKIMFRVRVLISKDIIGSQDMILPPYIGRWDSILRFDTTKKENGQVIVKYCDNEFYPEYLIHYTVTPQANKINNNNKNYKIRRNYIFTDFDDDIY